MYRDRKFELKEKYSHSYVSGIHACGRMLFRYAVELGLIRHNPAENFQLPKRQISIEDLESQKEASDFLDKDEIAHFLTWQKKWGWKWITSFKGVYSTHLY
jgi:site-specific recombinase XerD